MGNSKQMYLIDVGVLLEKEHPEFKEYSLVYNKQWGFYDENQYYEGDLEKAKLMAREYVENGCDMTYAVVKRSDVESLDLETYELEDVEYSVAKIEDDLIEEFLNS